MFNRPPNPFEPGRRIGTIIQVGPTSARLNLPLGAGGGLASRFGAPFSGGAVGEFAVIEGTIEETLARITEVRPPEGERSTVEPGEKYEPANPIGELELLSSFDLATGKPRLG